jgi:D-aspartate ligase
MAFARELPRKPVLIPTGDHHVAWLSRSSDRLRPYLHFRINPWEITRKLVDKSLMHRELETRSLPAPRTAPACLPEELEARLSGWRFPYLIKPVDSSTFVARFRFKLFAVRSEGELDRALRLIQGTGLRFLVQEYIPPLLHYEVYSLRIGGRPVATIGYDRVRQFPPGFGAASFCRLVQRPEALDLAVEALEAFEVEGPAAVELILDARDRRYRIIEINPRTTLQNRLAASGGVPLEFLLYRSLTGSPLPATPQPAEGLTWVDNFKDPAAAMLYVLRGEQRAADVIRQYLRPKVRSVFSLRDPLPYAAAMARMAGRLAAAARVRLSRRKRSTRERWDGS